MDFFTIAKEILECLTEDKDTLYVICPYNIGDFLIDGGFCYALLKKKRKRNCILIVRDRFRGADINFIGVSEIRYISQQVMDFLREYVYATSSYETDNYIYGHFHVKDGHYDVTDELSFVERYRENVLNLPREAEFLPPLVDDLAEKDIAALHAKYDLDSKRTIVLTPYANSRANMPETFWETLASEIHKTFDVTIYTNVAAPNEKVVPGTLPIVATFKEIRYIASNVKCFAGLRSGIGDFLALTTNVPIFYLQYLGAWHDDLKINYPASQSVTFYDGTRDKEWILSAMRGYNVESVEELNFFGRIEGKNVCLDLNGLLEKLLHAVSNILRE